ncbi:DNA polymerase [Paenibacillus sp. J5C_2022]|uniref:DNA polymerase n=1 Tax=Paenibacillus sp. J5C2022 TaxID=2977129 RepID=UPI0021D0910A|nr:DNA polymerase [Paenibacillus sp. J5C2022]MCU6709311.1 DNA polymerase [Paenibacillus sp. J5C2022]
MSLVVTDANYHAIVRKLIADDRKVPKGANLQNMPSKGGGVLVRNQFVPKRGYTFVGADLGQIEPRIQAHIMYERYRDNSLRQIFLSRLDLYTTMAVQTFGIDEKYCVDKAYDPTGTFKPRGLMKTGVLAKSYDQKPEAFSRKMGVTMEVATHFFESFDAAFPSFTQMVADIREFMRTNGYVETLYGRKRRFPDYKSVAVAAARNEQKLIRLYTERKALRNRESLTARDAERLQRIQDEIDVLAADRGLIGYWDRAAFNAVIQGTGADILKMNGNRNARECKARGWEFNASIHDEIKNSVPNADLTPETITLIDDIMTGTCGADLTVPLVTDIVIEPRWMQEFGPDEWDYAECRPKPEFENKYST